MSLTPTNALNSYAQGSNRLTQIGGTPPTNIAYDANGNITSENTRSFVYDFLNRLATVSDNGTQIAAYTYNGLNQRMKKMAAGGSTRLYHYDLAGHLIAETDGMGQTLVEYIYLGDMPLAMIRSGQVYYYHNDHLGTPMVLTDSAGAVVWDASYTPFGAATTVTATVENNIRFPGQYYDTETGLHYNWNRYYNPQTGRYLTPDPIGLEGGVNLFVYTESDPVNKTDPEGLDIKVCFYPEAAHGFGHVGFGPAVPNSPTWGFYPKGNPVISPGVVKPDTQPKKECKTIESTSKQDDCMQKCRDKRQKKPGWYSTQNRQCTYFLNDCLRECGLPAGNSHDPRPKNLYDALPEKS